MRYEITMMRSIFSASDLHILGISWQLKHASLPNVHEARKFRKVLST